MTAAGELTLPRPPAYLIVERVRLSPAQFEAMRIAERPDNLPVPPHTLCRVRIGGRWHACDRQYQCGWPAHFARPIVIVLDRAAVPA